MLSFPICLWSTRWQKLNAVFVSYLSVIVPDLSIAGDDEADT